MIGRVEGHSRPVIQDFGCAQEGRKLSWETRVEEIGFEVLPEFQRTGQYGQMWRFEGT